MIHLTLYSTVNDLLSCLDDVRRELQEYVNAVAATCEGLAEWSVEQWLSLHPALGLRQAEVLTRGPLLGAIL
jgi:hypothetical protein